jgi:hypothetical protein
MGISGSRLVRFGIGLSKFAKEPARCDGRTA